MESPVTQALPPLEKKLWSDLWKTKTSPKLRHFLWRVLSGALAVKERLRSRGMNLDTTCPLCGHHQETICHVLFTCDVAKDTWARAKVPLPPAGFSSNSVLLNLYHLFSISKKQSMGQTERLRFPWVLWHLWKARNSFCFEQKRVSAENVLSKAIEEASIWFKLAQADLEEKKSQGEDQSEQVWRKPPMGFVKCNVGCSWSDSSIHSGASWIIRDFRGQPMEHSRRSFIGMKSIIEADLETICWAANDLQTLHWNKVIIEISSPQALEALNNPAKFPGLANLIERTRQALHRFHNCSILVVNSVVNVVAGKIAVSVTNDGRFSSYIARGGPRWLSDIICAEAANSPFSLP